MNIWHLSCLISFAVLALSVVATVLLAMHRYKKGGFLTPLNTMVGGVFCSAWIFFYPLHLFNIAQGTQMGGQLVSVLAAAQHALRLFT